MKIYIIAVAIIFALVAECHAHDLSWTYMQGVAPADGFNVYRRKIDESSFTLLATLPVGTLIYSDPDRTKGNCYQLTAYNAFGESSPVGGCASVPDGSITVFVLK